MTKVGIVGYGNLGRGVEAAISKNSDMELKAVFTRRNPNNVNIKTPGVKVVSLDDLESYKDDIDVMIVCGGSATDLPEMTPYVAKYFNVIDSFDTHANIPSHFAKVDAAAKASGKTALISCGWDPGMFSINRLYAESILTEGKTYTFWGKGVSQGHSDAVRRIKGVVDARQYTIPVDATVDEIKNGSTKDYSARQMHTRLVYVVAEDGADKAAIEKEIKEMPNYFADYDTTVKFIDKEEMERDHKGLPHGGVVIRGGNTGWDNENHNTIEYKLTLDSNPQFTSSVLVAYARAVDRMNKKGDTGCKTVFDVAPSLLSPLSGEEIRAHLL